MQIVSLSQERLETQAQLADHLLGRIEEQLRATFLQPPSPFALSVAEFGFDENQFARALELLNTAIQKQQKVLIFGDYDCDGVTATAVLWEALRAKGLTAAPFLPHREKHGYGLSLKAFQEVLGSSRPDVVVTVDNGIVAHEAVAWLKQQGVTVIVTDHHEPSGQLPAADAIVHTTALSGAGVAWVIARELLGSEAETLLDLAVLGSVADQIPVLGVNRSLVVFGLEALRHSTRPSLQALAEVTGTSLPQASINTINYAFAPRINAMGRLYDAMDALRALLSRQPSRMQALVQQLHDANGERQSVTAEAIEAARQSLITASDEPIVIAIGPYHEGIIGLIASKLVDEFSKPAIVLSNLKEMYKASVRSVPGVHITELLRSLPPELFESLGGHAMAAGFSVSADNWSMVAQKLRETAQIQILPEILEPKLEVIGSLAWNLLEMATLETLQRFQPFGPGNEEPIFLLENCRVMSTQTVGKQKNHLKLTLQDQISESTYSFICFQYLQKLKDPDNLKQVAVKLKPSTYRPGKVDIEIVAGL